MNSEEPKSNNKTPLPQIDPGLTPLSSEYVEVHADIPAVPPSGGDFHQVFPIEHDGGTMAVVIGDVAGHGPQHTMQAEHMRTLLSDCLELGLSPMETLSAVNAIIEPDPNFEGFGTVFVGKIEAESGKIIYASGGHEPALIASPGDAKQQVEVEELIGTGPPVGAFPPEMARYEQREAVLPEGGTLLLYTDGVSDARPPYTRREWLGVAGLKKILAQFARLSPRRLITQLLRRVIRFCQGHFDDDVAVLAIRRRFSRRTKSK
jgi:sigma-B regulation protein RsbU (phosphoserine phosphatase)